MNNLIKITTIGLPTVIALGVGAATAVGLSLLKVDKPVDDLKLLSDYYEIDEEDLEKFL